MGGKHKQAQRTKNNARPSSSGRSAELLANTMPQFSGFSTMKETGFPLPTFSLSIIDEIDSTVNSNFQLVLKKMNKKDSTTKLKALQEFSDLIKTSDQEAVKTILAFWTRLYTVLSTDTEHKVREAAHLAHQQVVNKAKRNIAPYLKQLAGPWFTSQYDTYAPAASAATKSFEDAFPPNKLQEAIVFCQDEILSYICDNLTIHTPQTLSNPTTTYDDALAKFERIIISSLQGYNLYLTKVTSESIRKAEELNLKIVSNAKFWKLAKSKVAPIRTAWFGVLTALCQNAPFLLANEVGRVTASTFTNLDESEPTVLPNVWEAALLIVTTLDEWWTHVNIEKVLLPKLYKVLKEGGQGNASVIFPNLLPLLSHMPPTLDINTLYISYFDSMRAGLKQKNVITSRSELAAVSTTFIECLQYVILKNQSNVSLCEKLIKVELLSVIEWCLIETQVAYKSLFNQISTLIQYWHRNRDHPDVNNYPKYINYFWSHVDSLFQGLLMRYEHNYEKNAVSEFAVRQIEFLMSLKHISKPKKQYKVKFTSEVVTECGDVGISKTSAAACDVTYLTSLNTLVYKTCECYVKFINEKQSKELVEHLFSLLQDFESEEFFRYICQVLDGNEPAKLITIYNKLLAKWLKSSYLCSKSVVDLVFLLFKYLEPKEKLVILDAFSKLPSEHFGWCIARALAHPHNTDTIVQNWLGNEKVDTFLVGIVEKELLDECTPDLSLLLKQTFTESNNGELYISKSAVTQIVSQISTSLLSPSKFSFTIDKCASLAAYISSILYTETLKLTYGDDLVQALFTLSCNTRINKDTITDDTLWEVNTAWQDAVGTISSQLNSDEFNELTGKFSSIVDSEFLSNDVDDAGLEQIVNVVVSFLRAVQKHHPMLKCDLLGTFLNRVFMPEWRKCLTDVCSYAEYLQADLSCPYEPLKVTERHMNDVDILKYFMWSCVTASVLLSPIEVLETDEDVEEDHYIQKLNTMIKLAHNTDGFILNILYDLALLQSFTKNYKMTIYYKKINEETVNLKDKFKLLIDNLEASDKTNVDESLLQQVHENSWLWTRALHILNCDIYKKQPLEVYDACLKLEIFSGNQNLSRLHLTQVFSKSLMFDSIPTKLDVDESVVTLRSLLHCEELDVQIAETLGKIDKFKMDTGEKFYVIDFSNWKTTATTIEMLHLSRSLILNDQNDLSKRHWDFIVLLLASFSSKTVDIRSNYQNVQVTAFITAIANLFSGVEQYIKKLQLESSTTTHISEWKDVFSQDIHTDFVRTWLYLAEQFLKDGVTITNLPFLQSLESAISHVNYEYVFRRTNVNTPKWSKMLKMCCTLLTNPLTTLQLWGYHMLIALTPGLIEIDTLAVNSGTPHAKGLIFEQFKDLLVHSQEIVQTMLLDFRLCDDSCRVESFTDSYTYTFAYLLLWDILLTLCEKSSTELRYQYSDWLRNEDFLNHLLNNLFTLMPAEVLHYTDSKKKLFCDWFLSKSNLSMKDPVSSETLERMACWVYAATVSQLPASVRQWWSGTEARIAQIVERVTSAYVSPQLCYQELADVAQHETKFKNMVIKVHPTVREVIAIYTVDDAEMDLVITLPTNYPLGGPDVHCNKQIGGTSHKQWLMQLKMCVLHQNGRIWDGLALWNNNLNKKFDGVEECYICFAVLHPGTYQLPRLSCGTCRKKFHSACLYKWFSTSNKSTCPICRNLF